MEDSSSSFFWDTYEVLESVVGIGLGGGDDDGYIRFGPVFRRRGDPSTVYYEMPEPDKHRRYDPPRLGYVMICHILRRLGQDDDDHDDHDDHDDSQEHRPSAIIYQSLGERAVVKVFEWTKVQQNWGGQELPFREIEAARHFRHHHHGLSSHHHHHRRHVVTVEVVLQDRDGNLYMVMPLPSCTVSTGEPHDHHRRRFFDCFPSLDELLYYHGPLVRHNEHSTRELFRQLMRGLAHIHEAGWCHRDICCENFVVAMVQDQEDYHGYIIDFGLAQRVPRRRPVVDGDDTGQPLAVASRGACPGKPLYQSPEVFHRHPYYNAEKADVWSSGIVLLNLLTGYLYRAKASENPVECQRRRLTYGTPVAVHANLDELLLLLPSTGGNLAPLPPLAVDLVRHMLDMDAGNRFSISQVLNHPWLQQQQLQEGEEEVSIEAAYNHG